MADVRAEDVVYVALTLGPACSECGTRGSCEHDIEQRMRTHADLIVAALRERHLLAERANPDEAAQVLAEMSCFPRYLGEGWRRVRESSADVELAASQALARAGTSFEIDAIKAARAVLLRDVAHREHEG